MASTALRRSTRRLHGPGDSSAGGEAPPWHFEPAAPGDGRASALIPGSPVTRDNAVLGLLVIRGVDWKWVRMGWGAGAGRRARQARKRASLGTHTTLPCQTLGAALLPRAPLGARRSHPAPC